MAEMKGKWGYEIYDWDVGSGWLSWLTLITCWGGKMWMD